MNRDRLTPLQIFLIEDNPGDVELAREALRTSKLANELVAWSDGRLALAELKRRQAAHELPDLIFLDLNLPGMSGIEVLASIKATAGLGRIPVVILTSSQAETDIAKSYDLHANCYITKPLDFQRFIEVIHSIEEFWFTLVRLPSRL